MKTRYALRNVLVVGSIIAVLLAVGCASGPTIRSNLDPAADFNKFRTFGFFQPLSTTSNKETCPSTCLLALQPTLCYTWE